MLSNKTLSRMRDLERDKSRVAQKQASLVSRLKKDLAKVGLTVSQITRQEAPEPAVVHPDNKTRLARVVQMHNRRGRRRRKAA